MTLLENAFDILVCLLLLFLAWKSLYSEHLYQSAILFIAFGLTMALAWVRLAAPDVALAEAAIGAGLLGVLLVDSLRAFSNTPENRLEPKSTRSESDGDEIPSGNVRRFFNKRFAGIGVTATSILLAFLLVPAIIDLPDGGGLTESVAEKLDESGVDHAVTAVLLNFRGYDTWLEVGVLFLAMLGIFCAGGKVGFTDTITPSSPGPLLSWLIRGLVPLILLTAAYLLWLGKLAPGGAFQAGVALGAAGILLRLAGFSLTDHLPGFAIKLGLLLGFGVFLIFGALAVVNGSAFLEYPERWAGEIILIVEIAASVSIGFTVFAFFAYMNSRDQSTIGNSSGEEPQQSQRQ